MKILLFIDTIGLNGGAERQFAGLSVFLSKRGYNVHVMAYYPEEGFKSYLESNGVEVTLVNLGSSQFSKLVHAKRLFDNIKPDLIISYKNGPNLICTILKAMGAKWKLIVSDRNTVQTISSKEKLQYFLYRYADKIVPNSYSQRKFIEDNFHRLISKIKVITNFTDTEKFRPCQSYDYSEPSIKRIIIVGRITEQKNVLLFMDAVAVLKKEYKGKFSIDWFGGMKDKYYLEKCKARITKLNIADVFRFCEPVKDIDKIYPQYHFFCLPSIYEGFPNVVCEAMASGLPVAVSNICDNPNIVSEGEDGVFFNPNDLRDIASALKKLLNLSLKELTEMGIKARQKIILRNSKETFTNNYIDIIESMKK